MELEKILTLGSFDIELARWWTDNPITYSVTLVSDKGDFIYGMFPFKEKEFVSKSGRKAEYVFCKSDMEVRHKFGGKLAELDLGVLAGQNLLGFDHMKLDRNRDRIFLPGADNSEVCKTRIKIADRQRWRNNTSVDLDIMLVAQNYLGMFLADNKLETIAELFDVFYPEMNLGFIKSYTHEELDIAAEKALAGDMNEAYEIIKYNYEDTIVPYRIAKSIMPVLVNIAQATETDLFSAFNDSKSKLAVNLSARNYYRRLHQTMPGLFKKRYLDYRLDDPNKKQDKRMQMLKEEIEIEPGKGFFKQAFVAHMPFYSIANEINLKDKRKNGLAEKISQSSNVLERIIYSQIMDRFAAEVLSDIDESKENPAFNFRAKYGISPDALSESMRKKLSGRVSILKPGQIINISNSLLFLRDAADTGELEKNGYTNIGNVNLLSVEPGKVIYEYKGKIFSSGIDIPSKKEMQKLDYSASKRGRTNVETIVVREFIEQVFADPQKAYGQLLENVKKAAKLEFELKHYIYAVNARQKLDNFSETELKKEKAGLIREFGIKEGGKLMYINTLNNKHLAYDPEQKKFFKMANNAREYLEYDEKAKCFSSNDSVDVESYIEKIFGEKSKIRLLARTAYSKEQYEDFKNYVKTCLKNSVA